MRLALRCLLFDLLQWRENKRMQCLFGLHLGYMLLIMAPVKRIINVLASTGSPWLFPFITTSPNCILILSLLSVLMVCDAPLLYHFQKYIVHRIGKSNWLKGQVLYIVITSFIFWTFTLAESIVLLGSKLELTEMWGKTINTIAQSNIGNAYALAFSIDYKLIISMKPLEATLLAFFLAMLVSIFLGLLILTLNIGANKNVGTVVALVLVAMQHFAYMANGYWFFYISPISWMSLRVVNFSVATTHMPDGKACIIVLLVLCIALIGISNKRVKNGALDLVI